MAINFKGYLFDDSGNAIQGATVQLLEQDGTEEASTTTSSAGLWSFSEADQDTYDVKNFQAVVQSGGFSGMTRSLSRK